MADTQILTIVLATTPTFIVVLVGILLNNARIGDLRTDVRSSLADLRTEMRSALGDLRDVLRAEMATLRMEMTKNQSEMLAKFAEVDARLTRLEAKFGT